jgi:ribosomal protein L34E
MKCYDCGKELHEPGITVMRTEPGGSLSKYWMNKSFSATICAECAASRQSVLRYWVLAIIAIAALVALIAVISR